MASKRPTVLMGLLLVVLAGAGVYPALQERFLSRADASPQQQPRPGPAEQPLPGSNAISNATLARDANGKWIVEFDYFYTGEPKRAFLLLYQLAQSDGLAAEEQALPASIAPAVRGANHYRGELRNPSGVLAGRTEKIFARLEWVGARDREKPKPNEVLAEVVFAQTIVWADPNVAEAQRLVDEGKSHEVIDEARRLINIDRPDSLATARKMLQALLERSPREAAAYLELARIAMRPDMTPARLRESEALTRAALQIQPDSVDGGVLLAFLHLQQGRPKEAEALFVKLAALKPANPWLWTHWAQLLHRQGNPDAAIVKYREALAQPPKANVYYDRARLVAYDELLVLLETRKDWASSEALLQQEVREYPGERCHSVNLASFLVLRRLAPARAAQVLQDTPSPSCDPYWTNRAQALMHYATWAQRQDPGRDDSLRKARAFMPVNALLLLTIARNEEALPLARQLLAAGEQIDAPDTKQFTALAYALEHREPATARRLIQLGANPQVAVGAQQMPAALIPVLTRDFESIRLVQEAGVDYTKVRFQGTTAIDHAKAQGDTKLQRLLDPHSGQL